MTSSASPITGGQNESVMMPYQYYEAAALKALGKTEEAEEIIKKVVKEMHLPVAPLYPFIKLGAKIFGRFDLEETSPMEAMKRCTLPVVFVHGDTDDFVPYEMSVRLYDACASDKKELITIHGAGHGLAFPADQDGYVNRLKEIKEKWNLK